MSAERAVPLPDWPQPESGVPMPLTVADDSSLFVRYLSQSGRIAVVHFPLCSVFIFGEPNDEALGGHPLWGHGLKFHSVHHVENSSWIAQLERRNSVHRNHDRARFLKDKRHFIFTFHDSTLECVVNEGEFWPTGIALFDSEIEADSYIQNKKRT